MSTLFKLLITLSLVSFALSSCSPKRYEIPAYPKTNQPSEPMEEGKGDMTKITTQFSTQDSPETVKQFYDQELEKAGWSVELLPLAAIQPLPELPTLDSILVHGNDIRGCPLYYVNVIIEPIENASAKVTTISGAVPCY
jgi:hypothetical protein